ncbi:hypothetical protein E3P99_04029 [Wallemia hederae]|uniref:RRM domain-containing protein n=1 Tax=Wallemia hederae TaxID=1540922 RepID=A0A4T0FDP2_9BASI|nr:hypothetical protein E3P99_04029 [Wallemia hederae]
MASSRLYTSRGGDKTRTCGTRRAHSMKDDYDYYDKWIGSIVRVDNVSDNGDDKHCRSLIRWVVATDTTLLSAFRPAGPIRHIHIETVYSTPSDFRYAVIIYHNPQHARLATALSGMMIRGRYVTVTLVNSCCEIIPYHPQTMNDVLLEQRERFFLSSKIPQVSIFGSAPAVPSTMNKMDLLTTPHPSICLPPSDCVEPGSKLDEKDGDAKYLLDATEKVVLHGAELDDKEFIAEGSASVDDRSEEKAVAEARKVEKHTAKQAKAGQRNQYNDWEEIPDQPERTAPKAPKRTKPLAPSRSVNTNDITNRYRFTKKEQKRRALHTQSS